MNTFFINWQDPVSRAWHVVAKLVRFNDLYIFGYTEGALSSDGFRTFGNMTEKDAIYVSQTLFPILANRVMNEKRPEYHRYAKWAGLELPVRDPLKLMATMGGGRATDKLQVYPVPEKTSDGMYHTIFFSHGIRHLPDGAKTRVKDLSSGDQLFPMLDCQNLYDKAAVALRTDDPVMIVGYCPRYLAKDLRKILQSEQNGLKVSVKRINHDAPPQFRLLCEVVSKWPSSFIPCCDKEHQTIVDFDAAKIAQEFYDIKESA